MSLKLRFAPLALAGVLFSLVAVGQTVTSFSPMAGAPGDPGGVVINGSGFDAGPLVVTFNGTVDPTAGASTANQIQAQVPNGATTGPIYVSVDGGMTFAHSSQDFVIIGSGPYIGNFSPTFGGPSTTVTINGAHFTVVSQVSFNGASVLTTNPVDNQIVAKVPAGATTGPITVTNSSGSFTTSSNFFVAPIITGFSPTNGRSGTNVVITGTNFVGTSSVLFSGTNGPFSASASFIVLSNGAVRVTVPNGATNGLIRVVAPANFANTATPFIVQPSIFGFSPGFGPQGSSITVTGANFLGTSSVKFNGATASFSSVSFGQLTATVPATTTGLISVTTGDGTVTSSTLFYLPANITSFSPTNGGVGTAIAVMGVNFSNATVAFNGMAAASVHVTNNTTLGAVAPSGVTTGPISVTTPAGTTNSAGLFYVAPVVTGFSPTHGLPNTNVTISGSNFLGATAVRFNGSNASFTIPTNNNTIFATVPNGAQTGPITVVTPGGSNTSVGTFVLDYISDISVTVTDAPDSVYIGSNLTYTIVVANSGPIAAPNVQLSDTLPASVNLKSATTTQGSLATNSNPIIGTLGSIGVGGTATVTLTVIPQLDGTITNAATVTSDYTDPATGNNTSSATTLVLPLPLLSIERVPPNKVKVSWPLALTNANLQFKNVLTNINWSNVLTTQTISGNTRSVTETNTDPKKFYRLGPP